MHKTTILLIALFVMGASGLAAQGFAWGVKGGLTVGFQNWGGFEQDPLFKYHGIVFIESLSEEDKFALYSQLGLHQKGSAIRNRTATNVINGQFFRPPTREFIFNNLSLGLGAKQKFPFGQGSTKAYYMLGIRADYTIDTNLDEYTAFTEQNPIYAGFFPIDDTQFIREFNYGLTVGGGFEFPLAELISTMIEFTINPDFSFQYEQPEIPGVVDPWTGNSRTLPERQIRNVTFEVTVGFRFLNKYVYID